MNQSEFRQWQAAFIKQAGIPVDDAVFTDAWESHFHACTLADGIEAVKRTVADPRVVRTPPRDRLPIILDHVAEIHSERERKTRKPISWGMRPAPSEAWDRRMLAIGAIGQEEFEARQKKRKDAK